MREEFRADLLEVGRLLVSMAEAVRTAMSAATTALLSADKEGAERVIARDEEINALFRAVEEKVLRLLAQQAPVASDLRMVITSLHIGTDLERMGDLAEHVAKSALRRHPAVCVPTELTGVFGQMANIADRIAGKITLVLASRDIERAAELERDDDAMDELEKALFEKLLNTEWTHGVEAAVDAALLARFYERYADHAVNAGRHVIYLVTGEA
ncbi:phosphate signaling complex protein PhoU [Catellatospora citrea]|uniref:Phosphate-specific transport system accessory protein PhoU n=1 Tax=Catellatospora citrea TaxID=53366 RepID=A0A8J3KK06_9ACTN|nr:phosphate signaling complex protein PhoU [Catellatospora citrea]RKE08476.1 PhoU-like phosphate uptake regulator [Catellatospora citrea]GIG01438.1 phosphate transport system regulatory protein PhoU [Catellatospora citrea]